MVIKKIKCPKFRIGRNILNEYELRTLMADIAEGIVKGNFIVKDIQSGMICSIMDNGKLSCTLPSLAISSEQTLRLIKANRK